VAIPETPRIVYGKNPLEEVRCEIRFPPILKIDASAPASFQEAVRFKFPYFALGTTAKLPQGMPAGVAQLVEKSFSLIGDKSYSFTSEDRNMALGLRKEGFMLACRRYLRWEPFRECLRHGLETLNEIYRPSFFTHSCVRFKNSIRRGHLGLEERPWSSLLCPWVGGLLERPETAEGVEAHQSRCVVRLPDGAGKVEAMFALGVHQPSNEQVFVIEIHVYDDMRKDITDVLPRLDTLHRHAGHFFRWCITDELHRAMAPGPV
jgi:uncharacterized protein (TIGR04255 family)